MENQHTLPEQTHTSKVAKIKYGNIAKKISAAVMGYPKKAQLFQKKHVHRYLYTFAFEIGVDLPTDEVLKTIFILLLGSENDSRDSIEG